MPNKKSKLTTHNQLLVAILAMFLISGCMLDVESNSGAGLADTFGIDKDIDWKGLVSQSVSDFNEDTGVITFKGYDEQDRSVVSLALVPMNDRLIYRFSLLGQPFELSVRYNASNDSFKLQRDDIVREIDELSESDLSASAARAISVEVLATEAQGLSHIGANSLLYLGVPQSAELDQEAVVRLIDLTVYSIALSAWDAAGGKLCQDVEHDLVDWMLVHADVCTQ